MAIHDTMQALTWWEVRYICRPEEGSKRTDVLSFRNIVNVVGVQMQQSPYVATSEKNIE